MSDQPACIYMDVQFVNIAEIVEKSTARTSNQARTRDLYSIAEFQPQAIVPSRDSLSPIGPINYQLSHVCIPAQEYSVT